LVLSVRTMNVVAIIYVFKIRITKVLKISKALLGLPKHNFQYSLIINTLRNLAFATHIYSFIIGGIICTSLAASSVSHRRGERWRCVAGFVFGKDLSIFVKILLLI